MEYLVRFRAKEYPENRLDALHRATLPRYHIQELLEVKEPGITNFCRYQYCYSLLATKNEFLSYRIIKSALRAYQSNCLFLVHRKSLPIVLLLFLCG